MEKFKHKYIFYYFSKWDFENNKRLESIFMFFGRVRDGKHLAEKLGREYDYKKIF